MASGNMRQVAVAIAGNFSPAHQLDISGASILPSSLSALTGIILAGGKGSRLGRDKGLIGWKGRKVVEIAIDTLAPFCREILISSNNPEYEKFGCRVVPDLSPGNGPMMGIYSALKCSASPANLLLAVDNVLVTGSFYQYLLSKELSGAQVAVPFVGNRFYEPLVGYYSTTCISVMEQMMSEGNFKLPDLFNSVMVIKLLVEQEFADFHPAYFKSLNQPQDLQILNNLMPPL
jgi:molybdopterin-guanine dinucleotide biosynthesis protein A